MVRVHPPAPNGYCLPPLNSRVIEKVTIKVRQAFTYLLYGCVVQRTEQKRNCVKVIGSNPIMPILYAAVAQRQSNGLLNRRSRYRNSLAAPIAAGNRELMSG